MEIQHRKDYTTFKDLKCGEVFYCTDEMRFAYVKYREEISVGCYNSIGLGDHGNTDLSQDSPVIPVKRVTLEV